MRSRWVWRLLRPDGSGVRWTSTPHGRLSPALRRGFLTTTTKLSYDSRPVDITPLDQRKLTFDTHELVQDLETHGFDKTQAQTIVSVLSTLSNVSLDTIYKEMVTKAQQHETSRIRADNKLDINLERSRVTDMFTDQEKQLMEATNEFTKKDTQTRSSISETSNKIDTEIASLKTLMESSKLETVRYLAASVFTCLAIALGFYRFWKEN
ncbi:coiled-coil domain-containing protein 90B, mitochondrial isoform X3 [Psammomys obesus]|uniref:coiled-coil domain-containing protein 90B, mitochondrial isoform X3 n=1 Tax=Psammomys obesus TaxID=48139 RepID=UPI002452E2A1|nr:coiled-coil domain-containing protein 90B, mitochondrial isoform X3 [Psammomys obesus]